MACILLTDMETPTSSPPAPPNHLLSAHDPACTPHPKEEPSAACLSIHLHHQVKDEPGGGSKGAEDALSFPAGQYVAEELCISAAKACGEFQEELSSSSAADGLLASPPVSVRPKPTSSNSFAPSRTLLESLSHLVWIPDVDADVTNVSRRPWCSFGRTELSLALSKGFFLSEGVPLRWQIAPDLCSRRQFPTQGRSALVLVHCTAGLNSDFREIDYKRKNLFSCPTRM